MTKPIFGLLLGGVLGVFDGLTAYFTPEVRHALVGIVIGSTIKGLIAGVSIGFFAKKVDNLPLGIVFGLGVGLLLRGLSPPSGREQQHYYFETCCRERSSARSWARHPEIQSSPFGKVRQG
jgi:hypothetical protein